MAIRIEQMAGSDYYTLKNDSRNRCVLTGASSTRTPVSRNKHIAINSTFVVKTLVPALSPTDLSAAPMTKCQPVSARGTEDHRTKDSLSTFDTEQATRGVGDKFPRISVGEPKTARGVVKKLASFVRKSDVSPRQERKMKKLRLLVVNQLKNAKGKPPVVRSLSQEAKRAESVLPIQQESYESLIQNCKSMAKRRRTNKKQKKGEIKVPLHMVRALPGKYQTKKSSVGTAGKDLRVSPLELPDDSNYYRMVSFIADLKCSMETPANARKVSKLPTGGSKETVRSCRVLPSGSLVFQSTKPKQKGQSPTEDVVITPLSRRFSNEAPELTELAERLIVRESWNCCDPAPRSFRQPIQARQEKQPSRKSQLVIVREMFSPAAANRKEHHAEARLGPVSREHEQHQEEETKAEGADLDYGMARERLHIQTGEALSLFPKLHADGILDELRLAHCDVIYDVSITPSLMSV